MDVPPACGTFNAQQLRVVQQLLWNVISQQLYPAERDEIRRALGESVLDENEVLFAEAKALADIIPDAQLMTEKLLAEQQKKRRKDPKRAAVEDKIRELIDQLHASAAVAAFGGSTAPERDPVSLLPPAKGEVDKAVLEYVTTVTPLIESGRPHSSGLPPRPPTSSSRPPTSLSASAAFFGATASSASRPGTASPTGGPAGFLAAGASRPTTASSGGSSAATRYTEAGAVVAAVGGQLSVASIDAVQELLRGALADERAALMEDIEYLQGLLDVETDLHIRVKKKPPSIESYTDYKKRLELVVEKEEARVEHEVLVSAIFAAAEQEAGRAGRLRGMVDASRRPPSAGGDGGDAGVLSLGAAGAGSSGGGNVQTLVVHGDDDAGASNPGEVQHADQEQQHADPERARPMSRASASTSPSPSPHSLLTSIHTGHGSVATAGPLPPVLPPLAGRAPPVGSPLLAVRSNSHGPHSPMAAGLTSGATAAAEAPSSLLRVAGPAGLLAQGSGNTGTSPAASPVPPRSSLQQPPSPGRLRPGQRLAPDTLASGPSLLNQHQNGSSGSSSGTGAGLGLGAVGASSSPGMAREGSSAVRQPPFAAPPPKPSLAAGSCGAGSSGAGGNGPVPAVLAAGTGSSALKALGRSGPSGAGGGTVAASVGPGSSSRIGGPPAGTRALSVSSASGTSGTVAGIGSSRVTSGPSSVVASARALVNSTIGGGGGGSVAASPGGASGKASSGLTISAFGLRTVVGGSTATPATRSPPTSALPGSRAAALETPAGVAHVSSQPHPRALLGAKGSVVERLEAEVDSVKGGLAAILEKYNLRPSTPSAAGAGSGK